MNHKSVHIIIVFLLALLCQTSYGQRWFRTSSLEFGIIAGASHYSGDLTRSYLETRSLKPSLGIITRYTPGELFTFRLSGQWAGLEGNDQWYESEEDETRRNLNFQSILWDFTAAAEVNLVRMDYRQSSGVQPYIFAGVSVFTYNPKTQFIYDPNSPHVTRPNSGYTSLNDRDGDWVELQPLGTEGQETTKFNERKRYDLTQIAIPFGAGFKFKLSNNWSMGIEYGARYTFTDYLDDVSTTYVDPTRIESQYGPMAAAVADRGPVLNEEGVARGDSNNKDMYGIFGFTFTYRIYGNKVRCFQF